MEKCLHVNEKQTKTEMEMAPASYSQSEIRSRLSNIIGTNLKSSIKKIYIYIPNASYLAFMFKMWLTKRQFSAQLKTLSIEKLLFEYKRI